MTGSSTNDCEETVHVVLNQNTRKWAQRNQPLNYQYSEGARWAETAAALVVHLLTAQQVMKYVCPARSQTILKTPAENDFSL